MVVNFDHTSSNPVRIRRTIIFEYGPIPASFRFFTSVSHNNFNNTNGKIVDDVLEIRTRGSIMVGEDETTVANLNSEALIKKNLYKQKIAGSGNI